MCLECSGKHRGLGVHISFVRSVTMDSWSEIQLKKMEAGGNEALNAFFAQYGIAKETDIVAKYNTNAAAVYRDRIQALAEGRPWRDPPVVKDAARKPPLGQSSGGSGRNGNYEKYAGNGGWDSWDSEDIARSDIRRNQSAGDVRGGSGGARGAPVRSRSTEDMYTRSQLEASAANKESFFSRKIAENESKPDGIPPSQGGKYVGFGSTPPPSSQGSNAQGDVLRDTVSVVSQGFGRLSLVAASAAQSAANVVQAGTKELTSKVKDGGYDQKVNETVNVVTMKTSEIGVKTWGIMKGVMAMASQKVEEYTKDANWKSDNWQRSDSNGYYQEFGQDSKGWNSSSKQFDSVSSSSSWDDWGDQKDNKSEAVKGTQSGESWAGWDDAKDEGSYHSASKKNTGQNGKSDSLWTEGGFL